MSGIHSVASACQVEPILWSSFNVVSRDQPETSSILVRYPCSFLGPISVVMITPLLASLSESCRGTNLREPPFTGPKGDK